jgi:hypothetical protein
MPVDLFPEIKIPVVAVATFYSGMPPEQIESHITNLFERFFTLRLGFPVEPFRQDIFTRQVKP